MNNLLEQFKRLNKDDKLSFLYDVLEGEHVSFGEFVALYVNTLKEKEAENRRIQAELSTCLLMETVYQRKRKSKTVKGELTKLIHRTIAILDKVGFYNVESMKADHSYDEKLGKSQGLFWKNN